MSVAFCIELTPTITGTTAPTLVCHARLVYTGDDAAFIQHANEVSGGQIELDELAYVTIDFHSTPVDVYTYRYLDSFETWQTADYTDGYHGVLRSFFNMVTRYKLDLTRFPFLAVTRGIASRMLLCCIGEALEWGFVTPSSTILVEASGVIRDMDTRVSMAMLVRNYEAMGFSQMMPQHYEHGITVGWVPMVGQVERLMRVCAAWTRSDELLARLPIPVCHSV